MRGRLAGLGWSEIDVIDDDLARSAAGGVQRAGFERMVAEVCLGKVGSDGQARVWPMLSNAAHQAAQMRAYLGPERGLAGRSWPRRFRRQSRWKASVGRSRIATGREVAVS